MKTVLLLNLLAYVLVLLLTVAIRVDANLPVTWSTMWVTVVFWPIGALIGTLFARLIWGKL
jgi:hypothetical protein